MFANKKTIISLLILVILVLAIPLGVELVRRQQIFQSRATAEPIVFTGPNVKLKDGKWVATKPQISLEITSPLGPPVSPTPTPTPTPIPPQPPPKDTSPIISYEAFHYTGSSGQKVMQKFISKDGGHWERKCTVSGSDVNCPGNGWVKDPNVFTSPDGSPEKIITFGAFSYKGVNDTQKILQAIISENGNTWSRTCAVAGDNVNCPGWDKGPNTIAPDGSGQKIISYAAVSYSSTTGQKVSQSYIAENGDTFARTCTVSGDSVSCPNNTDVTNTDVTQRRYQGWEKYPQKTTAPDKSATRILTYGAFSYTEASTQKVMQTLIGDNGNSFTRTCAVSGADLDCPRIGGVWGNGWSEGPKVSAP